MKENTIKLDKRDKQILYLLDINGRTPYSTIAKKVKISKQLVKYKVERLEKEGIIKGYYTLIDHPRMGYTPHRVYLKFKSINEKAKKRILDFFKAQKRVWAVVQIIGKWDLAIGISTKTIQEFHKVWEHILENQLPVIKEYKMVVYAPIYHFSKSYLKQKEEPDPIKVLGLKEETTYDKKDIIILKELGKNAREHITKIAKKAKLTPEATSRRIKELEKKEIIKGYRANIDDSLFGYEFYKTEVRLKQYKKVKSILEFCHKHPNIFQVNKPIGGETLEIEFNVKSVNQLIKAMQEIENCFPNTIESYEYIQVVSFDKLTYLPEE